MEDDFFDIIPEEMPSGDTGLFSGIMPNNPKKKLSNKDWLKKIKNHLKEMKNFPTPHDYLNHLKNNKK